MDDYKRTVYMYARALVVNSSETPVCCALETILFYEGADDSCALAQNEIFTEFSKLFDGKCWDPWGNYKYVVSSDFWWEFCWSEPRVRALDCILRE